MHCDAALHTLHTHWTEIVDKLPNYQPYAYISKNNNLNGIAGQSFLTDLEVVELSVATSHGIPEHSACL